MSLNVDYDTLIPNNVGLSSDRRVLKALEKWHPGYISWWNDLIPQAISGKPGLSAHRDQRSIPRAGRSSIT